MEPARAVERDVHQSCLPRGFRYRILRSGVGRSLMVGIRLAVLDIEPTGERTHDRPRSVLGPLVAPHPFLLVVSVVEPVVNPAGGAVDGDAFRFQLVGGAGPLAVGVVGGEVLVAGQAFQTPLDTPRPGLEVEDVVGPPWSASSKWSRHLGHGCGSKPRATNRA